MHFCAPCVCVCVCVCVRARARVTCATVLPTPLPRSTNASCLFLFSLGQLSCTHARACESIYPQLNYPQLWPLSTPCNPCNSDFPSVSISPPCRPQAPPARARLQGDAQCLCQRVVQRFPKHCCTFTPCACARACVCVCACVCACACACALKKPQSKTQNAQKKNHQHAEKRPGPGLLKTNAVENARAACFVCVCRCWV